MNLRQLCARTAAALLCSGNKSLSSTAGLTGARGLLVLALPLAIAAPCVVLPRGPAAERQLLIGELIWLQALAEQQRVVQIFPAGARGGHVELPVRVSQCPQPHLASAPPAGQEQELLHIYRGLPWYGASGLLSTRQPPARCL